MNSTAPSHGLIWQRWGTVSVIGLSPGKQGSSIHGSTPVSCRWCRTPGPITNQLSEPSSLGVTAGQFPLHRTLGLQIGKATQHSGLRVTAGDEAFASASDKKQQRREALSRGFRAGQEALTSQYCVADIPMLSDGAAGRPVPPSACGVVCASTPSPPPMADNV